MEDEQTETELTENKEGRRLIICELGRILLNFNFVNTMFSEVFDFCHCQDMGRNVEALYSLVHTSDITTLWAKSRKCKI